MVSVKPFVSVDMFSTESDERRLYSDLLADNVCVDKSIMEQAKRLEPEACFIIGDIYYQRQDYKKALRWNQQALKGNHPMAQERMGRMFQNGSGVAINLKSAMEWYLKSHENGNTAATNDIGFLYFNGLGVSHDAKLAIQWFLKAAAKENKMAQFNLGAIYENGRGVAPDKRQALEWYERSADQGYEPAIKSKNDLLKNGITLDVKSKAMLDVERTAKAQSNQIKTLEKQNKALESQMELLILDSKKLHHQVDTVTEENKALRKQLENLDRDNTIINQKLQLLYNAFESLNNGRDMSPAPESMVSQIPSPQQTPANGALL